MTHPNITYYRITEASTFKEAVSDLITISKTSPVLTHSNIREDNYKRFIILDELQNASKQSISPFLDSLEFAAKDVTIILISMDLDSMDVIVKDAIESRCIELNLSSLSENLITNKLINTYPKLSNKAAKLIAYLSNGNIRQAWSILEFFNTQISIEEITSDYIAEQKLNNLTQANIELIIDSIQYTCWQNSLSLINKYISDSPSCVDYLIKYLLNENLDLKGIELISSLSFWLQCNYKSPLAALFLPFQNTRLIKETENINTKSSSIKTIYSTEKILTNTAQDIQNQLTKIIGSSVSLNNSIPTFLQFKKWSQFITNYADNN
jgi:DNA polymerase III gamma/tau subunit